MQDMNGTANDIAGDASPSASTKRQRAKHACEPCRLRKRKCDGSEPCNMCLQFEYTCYFEKHPRKRSKIVEQRAVQNGRLSPPSHSSGIKSESVHHERASLEDISKQRALEANSGIAFTRLLSSRLDPSSGSKLFTSIGWNLGSNIYVKPTYQPITDFLSHKDMVTLAKLYFDNVHPLYGFMDKPMTMSQIDLRWTNPEACSVPDHLLIGVASAGTLFSDGSYGPLLPGLLAAAKTALESTSTLYPPNLSDVQSWLLRSLYLRATGHPHSVWMSSCTTMHLVESTGIHQEMANTTLRPPTVEAVEHDKEIRRRTFWIARLLNTWVSFEYGRTRVALRGITAELPTPREGDFTLDYINLYSISCCLDPELTHRADQWEEFLRQLEEFDVRHDGIELSRANLGMCGYRRIRLANPTLSPETTNRIIRIALKGLEAARKMMEKSHAWWHVVNVPFQVICVLLAMDSRESLEHLGTAMRTLEAVVQHFKTAAMKEALKTARFLVRLSKKRKDEDSGVLSMCLSRATGSANVLVDENVLLPTANGNGVANAPELADKTPGTASSSEDWNMDILSNSDFDWNYFLTTDMPAFTSFAPDGIM